MFNNGDASQPLTRDRRAANVAAASAGATGAAPGVAPGVSAPTSPRAAEEQKKLQVKKERKCKYDVSTTRC